jgi:hypothetical protein
MASLAPCLFQIRDITGFSSMDLTDNTMLECCYLRLLPCINVLNSRHQANLLKFLTLTGVNVHINLRYGYSKVRLEMYNPQSAHYESSFQDEPANLVFIWFSWLVKSTNEMLRSKRHRDKLKTTRILERRAQRKFATARGWQPKPLATIHASITDAAIILYSNSE